MKDSMRSFALGFCGLVTSMLAAWINVLGEQYLDFNLFTLTFWFIIPAGALIVGAAAASGYYFGAVWLHEPPTRSLLWQMVIIAGSTQLLIYQLEYQSFVSEGGSGLSFWDYTNFNLSHAHYRMQRGGGDIGEMGSFGYVTAGLQFLAFLLSGLGVYLYLKEKAICNTCTKYFRPLVTKKNSFEASDMANRYYAGFEQIPLDEPAFAAHVKNKYKVAKVRPGTINIRTALSECPSCKAQMIEDHVTVYNGKQWEEHKDLHRRLLVPEGLDLRTAFKA